MIYQESLSRRTGEVETRSAKGEGAADRRVLSCAAKRTVRFAAPSPGAARRSLPQRGRG
jgi:hypothetical protein